MWTWLWLSWIGLFLILEAVALVRKERGDTLSEHVWNWFSLKGKKHTKKPWQVAVRFGFIAFWAWLTIHFITGGSFL
jgi:hypothetical protein